MRVELEKYISLTPKVLLAIDSYCTQYLPPPIQTVVLYGGNSAQGLPPIQKVYLCQRTIESSAS